MSNTVELHPSAPSAVSYLNNLGAEKLREYQQTFNLLGGQGNPTGMKCSETLKKLIANETMDDRELLGLAWTIRDMELSA